MMPILSAAPPSPRAIQARNAFSRRSRRRENARNGSTLERASVTVAGSTARVPARRRGRPLAVRGQARKVVLGVERQRIALLVGEHALAELGAERRQPLADLGEPAPRRLVEPGAGAAEGHKVPFQHARLLGIEAGGARPLIAAIRPNSAWFM